MSRIPLTIHVLVILGLLLIGAEAVMAAMPPVGSPEPPAANLSPPKAFIGMLSAFFCFFVVVGANLIPSKRSQAE